MIYRKRLLLLVLATLALLLVACSSSGLPSQPGDYDIQAKTINYDGQEYSFYWVDKDKTLHLSRQDDIKMVQDSRTYLEMRGNEPILHLGEEEPISVKGEDRNGP
ncbi:MAG: hypothetical protein Q8P59_03760, partial [Dehalococcoidia bacterium]|nr:hypothetical protein [Dehalococcoidia bacterium]